jgi:hypothetical protein
MAPPEANPEVRNWATEYEMQRLFSPRILQTWTVTAWRRGPGETLTTDNAEG